MIHSVSSDRPIRAFRPAVTEAANDPLPVVKTGSVARPPVIDPFDAADVEFDFAAADKAAAATLLRDQQQMKLAEMADARSQGSISVQEAMAAYGEFHD